MRLALRGAAHLPGRELGVRLFSPPADQIELPDYELLRQLRSAEGHPPGAARAA